MRVAVVDKLSMCLKGEDATTLKALGAFGWATECERVAALLKPKELCHEVGFASTGPDVSKEQLQIRFEKLVKTGRRVVGYWLAVEKIVASPRRAQPLARLLMGLERERELKDARIFKLESEMAEQNASNLELAEAKEELAKVKQEIKRQKKSQKAHLQEKRRETDAKCEAMLKEAYEARNKMVDAANKRYKAAEDAAAKMEKEAQTILDSAREKASEILVKAKCAATSEAPSPKTPFDAGVHEKNCAEGEKTPPVRTEDQHPQSNVISPNESPDAADSESVTEEPAPAPGPAPTPIGVMQKILDEQAAAAIKITAWLRKYLARRATTAVVANS